MTVKVSESSPESRLKGSLVRRVATEVGLAAVSRLQGSLVRKQESEGGDTSLIPEGYDWPDEAAEALALRMETISGRSTPYRDPSGFIHPGAVFTSPRDPTHRRLVALAYTTEDGRDIVAMHIEGDSTLRNLPPASVGQKISEGTLIPTSVGE